MSWLLVVLQILIFPGLLFLVTMGLAGQFVDRKLYARLQNRVGPPWYQPVADLFKLFGKESVIPEEADRRMFTLSPVFALAAVVVTVALVGGLYPAISPAYSPRNSAVRCSPTVWSMKAKRTIRSGTRRITSSRVTGIFSQALKASWPWGVIR